jgi:hypothetical protein
MPVDLLTEAERERWQRFPDTVPQDDLVVFFQLSDEDKGNSVRLNSCMAAELSDATVRDARSPPSHWPIR